MNVDDCVDDEVTELIGHRRDGNKRVKGKVVAKQQDSPDENELINNGIAEHVKERNKGGVQARFFIHVPQQQPQGTTVCWERFLHLRSLKVLLVEKDSSTRQVVAALLRNCSYDVIETANGLQAWRIIEDLSCHIDLVLTEVAIPFHSGIALLSKIMNHKTRHNVPVIMMSSHDSMGLVVECLANGAVDFLVKPIRKNELKNLWQHVWRRCHSSSGSGSGSDTKTQKSVKLKSFEKSDNNIGSNDEDGNKNIGLNAGDGSDDESGAQSSWTQQVVEAESPRPTAPQYQTGECPDSTCAQVIHSNAETFAIEKFPVTSTRVCQEQELGNVLRGKELEIGTPGGINLQLQYPNEVAQNNMLEICEQFDISKLNCETPGLEAPNRLPKIYDTNNEAISASKELPSLELSLKRARGVNDTEIAAQEERHVLRRSDSSAFSRSSNYIDMGSTSNSAFNKPLLMKNKSAIPSPAFQPLKNGLLCSAQQVKLDKSGHVAATTALAQPRDKHNGEVQIQQIRHYNHHLRLPSDYNDSLKKMATNFPHCGSSNNVFGGMLESDVGNSSFHGSASGSNYGSNGQNGSNAAVNAGAMNMESDNGIAQKSGSGDASASGGGNIVENKLEHREAALAKFRQKRKERCFRKKVRYQSRKKLAEQRPRVRGQFVRQKQNGNANQPSDP